MLDNRCARMGVFCVRGSPGKCFIGFSYNLESTFKRLRFELNMNACSYKALQSYWNACGPLEFCVLEEFVPEEGSGDELDARIKARMFTLQKTFGSDAELLQTSVQA
ncbi:MAG: hypothetical protein AAGU74_11345 [Bacillota bacterium]